MSELRNSTDGSTEGNSSRIEYSARLATPIESGWCDFAIQESHKPIEICRDTAKTFLQLLGIVLPGYVASMIAVYKGTSIQYPLLMLSPCLFWIPALIIVMFIVFPWKLIAIDECPKDIESAYTELARKKKRLLNITATLFVLGMICLGLVFSTLLWGQS